MSGDQPLRRWERAGLAGLLIGLAAFGGLVLARGAFQHNRKTDFGVYARAGYAVRADLDIYDITDDNAWHYCYPPPFAVLMVPLADPQPWADRTGYLPYWVGVLVWYLLGVWLCWRTADRLAGAALPDARPGSRRWWYARLVPLYLCVGGLGFTLARGQVNVLVLWLVAGQFAAAVRGRPYTAGLWLAASCCLKVIPGYLSLFHVVRGEWRAGVGAVVGSLVLLVAVPAAVWGPAGAVALNRQFVASVLAPGATGDGDQTRAKELTAATATDSQSFAAVVHNWRHPDRLTRPADFDGLTRAFHLGVGGLMTVVTLAAGWRVRGAGPANGLVFLGCLSAVMLLLTPVSHMHYYAYALPLVAGLWLDRLARSPGAAAAGGPVVGGLVAWGVLTAAPLFPGPIFDWGRQFGLGTVATVGLWLGGVVTLLRWNRAVD